jgi:hypothetical protein
MAKLTRREVVVAGGLGVGATVAASWPGPAVAAPAADAAQREVRLLEGLLEIEQALQYAYRRVLQSWSFDPSTRAVLQLALRHEVEHAAVLEQQMPVLGSGSSPAAGAGRPGSTLSDVRTLLNGAQTPREALQVLTRVESLSEADYFNAVGEFQSPQLALTAAQILACEAQHWSLLLNVLTEGHLPEVVPDPFVRGVGQLSS